MSNISVQLGVKLKYSQICGLTNLSGRRGSTKNERKNNIGLVQERSACSR